VSYGMVAGTTATWAVQLDHTALRLLAGAKHHTLNATQTVTVAGGRTIKRQTTLVAPFVTALTTRAGVARDAVQVKLRCSQVTCRGRITLNDGKALLANVSYGMVAGTTATWAVQLDHTALRLLAGAKHHTLNATQTVTVTDGMSIKKQIALVCVQ
jgi:hypothetical protein